MEELQAVDVDMVKRVAGEYLTPSRFTRVGLAPAGAGKTKSVSSATSRSEDIRKIEFPNGLTALLLADHRLPFVQASGVFRGGLLAETPEKNGVTRLMSRLLVKDSKKRSGDAIAEAIESVGGGIGSSIGNNTFGVSAYAMRPDLDLVVELLGETILDAAFPEKVLEKEKQFQLAQIKAELDRPFSVAMKRLRKELYGDHPMLLR